MGNFVSVLEARLGTEIPASRTIIDGFIVFLIIRRAVRPGFGGPLLYFGVCAAFGIQALTRYGFTFAQLKNPDHYNTLWYYKDLTLNIQFILILLAVWAYAIPKSVAVFRANRSNKEKRQAQDSAPAANRVSAENAVALDNAHDDMEPATPQANGATTTITKDKPSARETFSLSRFLRQLFSEVASDD